MTDNKETIETPPEVPTQDPDTFSPSERAYFDSRGEKEIPTAEAPKEPAVQEPPKETPKVEEPPKEERQVNYGALAEERARRKELESKVREMEVLQARWEERFKATQPQPEKPKAPPSPDEDIFGAVKHDRADIDSIRQEINHYKQQQQQQERMVQFANWATQAENDFKKTNTDYDDAFKHLASARSAELREGWNMNDVQIAQQLQQEWRQIVFRAAQERRNPAELTYNLAKARGYQKKATTTEADESKKLDVIEAGQEASKSLSQVGGKSGGGQEITALDILKMPPDEFDTWKNKNPAKFRRIMGAAH